MAFDDAISKWFGGGRGRALDPNVIRHLPQDDRSSAITNLTRAITGFDSRPRSATGRRKWDSAQRRASGWVRQGRTPSPRSQWAIKRATSPQRPNRRAQRATQHGGTIRIYGNLGPTGKGQRDYKRPRWSPEFDISKDDMQKIKDAMRKDNPSAVYDVLNKAINKDDYATMGGEVPEKRVSWDLGSMGNIDEIEWL